MPRQTHKQSGAWHIASAYLRDYRDEMGDSVVQQLMGSIRARDVASILATVERYASEHPGAIHTKHLSQVKAFFSKNASLSRDDVAEQAAKLTFLRMEERCRCTNARLLRYSANVKRYPNWLIRAVDSMQADIAGLMGPVENYLNEIPNLVRVTSGATADTSRIQSRRDLKLRRKVAVTEGCLPLIDAVLRHFGVEDVKVYICQHNRIEFVPKNFKTKRTIACEPKGNLVCQLTFDAYGKTRLLRWGVDLRHGQASNSAKAKSGSISGEIATVDFESASDCTAARAVELLWPQEWYSLLSRMRSPEFRLGSGDGVSSGTYHKFSSMGNGTTFVIETTIFAAAARALGSRTYAVYGDDVVIERELAPRFMRLCRFLGFHVNTQKTHWLKNDRFRESCGEDYYDGILVTPFYLRNDAELRREVCHNINGLASVAKPGGELAVLLRKAVEYRHLPFVPVNTDTGSGVFISAYEFYARWESRLYVGRVGLRFGDEHVVEVRGLVETAKMKGQGRSWKRLLLWHLEKSRVGTQSLLRGAMSCSTRSVAGEPSTYVSTSRYTTDEVSVRCGWTVLRNVGPTPTHLYWWDEFTQRTSPA